MQYQYMSTAFMNRVKPVPFPLPPDELEYFAEAYPEPYNFLYMQMYKFGQRVTEAINVKAGDIRLEDHNGDEVIVLNSITEKNKNMPFRVLPCVVKDKMSKALADFYTNNKGELYKGVSRQMAYNEISQRGKAKFSVMALVPYKTDKTNKNQWRIESIEYCMHPHFLRHCCLTHKILYEDYNIMQLTTFAGWSTPAPALVYVHLNWRELIK